MKKIISTNNAPAAIGPYSQAVTSGQMVYTSGQIAIDPTTGELVSGDVQAQTRQVMKNLQAILQAAGSDLKNVVKTTCMLADINDFAAFNAVYAESFCDNAPSRSTFAVKSLPKGALVEVEVVAEVD